MELINSYYSVAISKDKYILLNRNGEKKELPIGQFLCDFTNNDIKSFTNDKECYNITWNEQCNKDSFTSLIAKINKLKMEKSTNYMQQFIYDNNINWIEECIENERYEFKNIGDFFASINELLRMNKVMIAPLVENIYKCSMSNYKDEKELNKAKDLFDFDMTSTLLIKYHIQMTDFGLVGLYNFPYLLPIAIFDLANCIQNKAVIKKCKNCDKYFVVNTRSDVTYCNNQAPQDESKTCKEYGAQKAWEDSLKNNECLGLARSIYMSKQMIAKRNPDIMEYKEAFEEYKIQNKQWKADIKKGIKTEQEFLTWLYEIKEKKV